MKLLKVADLQGHFLAQSMEYRTVDLIERADLLNLVSWTLNKDDVEFDPYDEAKIMNQAIRSSTEVSITS